MTTSDAQYERGWQALTRINQTSNPRVIRELEQWAPDLARSVVEFGYGSTYARDTMLADRDRQIATISALTAMGGCESQLDIHFTAALKMGIPAQELIELMQHLSAFCGFPRVLNASSRLRQAIAALEGKQ